MSGDVPLVAGSNLTVSRRVARELVGSDAFERALSDLSPEERSSYMDSTAMSWVPVAHIDRALERLAHHSGHAAEWLSAELARRSQEEMLNTLYRVLMRITTDEALIGRTQTFYSKVYDTGSLSSVFPAPGRCEVTLSGWRTISDLQLVGLGAGVETTLRCAGRKDARVQGRRTADGAFYLCTWRK